MALPQKSSQAMLHNLPLFVECARAQMRAGKKAPMSAAAMLLRSCEAEVAPMSTTTFSCTMLDIKSDVCLEMAEEHLRILSCLRELHHLSPSSTAALQVDDEGCFFQMLIATPCTKEIFETACLETLFADEPSSRLPLVMELFTSLLQRKAMEGQRRSP